MKRAPHHHLQHDRRAGRPARLQAGHPGHHLVGGRPGDVERGSRRVAELERRRRRRPAERDRPCRPDRVRTGADQADSQWWPDHRREDPAGPQGHWHDQQISSYSLPILIRETISAQSAGIDMVSGATYTSDGYIRSLQSALDQLNAWSPRWRSTPRPAVGPTRRAHDGHGVLVRPALTRRLPVVVDEVVEWLHWVDATFSTYVEDSEISQLRRREIGFAVSHRRWPTCWRSARSSSATPTARSAPTTPGPLDPSGLVKGWAIERAAQMLWPARRPRRSTAAATCARWGRAVLADRRRRPVRPQSLATVVSVVDGAVATSGIAERGLHVVDPRRRPGSDSGLGHRGRPRPRPGRRLRDGGPVKARRPRPGSRASTATTRWACASTARRGPCWSGRARDRFRWGRQRVPSLGAGVSSMFSTMRHPPTGISQRDHPGRGPAARRRRRAHIRDLLAASLRFAGFEVATARAGARRSTGPRSPPRPARARRDDARPRRLRGRPALRDQGRRRRCCSSPRATRRGQGHRADLGGDDYVTKPFSLEEVVARIRAVLRRTRAPRPRRRPPRSSSPTSSSTRTPTRCGGPARWSSCRRPSSSCCAT